MQIPLPKSFKYKISLHSQEQKIFRNIEEQNTQTSSTKRDYVWIKKYDTQANYLDPQNFVKTINPLHFGVSFVNPYHIFQIRKLPEISHKMRILKAQDWFKIKDISKHDKNSRFLNIIAVPLPAQTMPLMESRPSDEVFNFVQSILCTIQTTLSESILHGSEKCMVYLEEQDNVDKYPCIIIKMNFLKPCATALPSYEIGFSINAISYNQSFMILLASKCVTAISIKTIEKVQSKIYSEQSFGTKSRYQYKISTLDHVGTSWDTTEDRFSVRAQIKYQGTISLEKDTSSQLV